MDFDLSNTRRWFVPHGGTRVEALKVVDGAGRIIWRKYFNVTYDDNTGGNRWKVTFNPNGGSGTMSVQYFEPGVPGSLDACAYTRSGWSFSGWNTSPDGSGTPYSNGQTLTPASDLTLYAQWIAGTHLVSFFPNGGTGTMSPLAPDVGSVVSLPPCDFLKTGHDFAGWDSELGEMTDEDIFRMPDEDVNLTAQWEPSTYTVQLLANKNESAWPGISPRFADGSSSKTVQVTYGQPYPVLPVPFDLQGGYMFSHWYDNIDRRHFPDGGQIAGNVGITSDRPFYAQWTPNTYTVTLDGNGGSGGPGSVQATYRR